MQRLVRLILMMVRMRARSFDFVSDELDEHLSRMCFECIGFLNMSMAEEELCPYGLELIMLESINLHQMYDLLFWTRKGHLMNNRKLAKLATTH